MKQLRNAVFTWNNFPDGVDKLIQDMYDSQKLPIGYIIYGREVGESGTPHLQGYLEFHKRVAFAKVKKLLPQLHIEPRLGTQSQAVEYCKKGNNYLELGEAKEQGFRSDIKKITQDIEEFNYAEGDGLVRDLTLKGDFSYARFKALQSVLQYCEPGRSECPEVTWIYGDSGAGKTRLAVEMLPNAYFKSNNSGKWWPGYDGHTEVIIDDVRPSEYPFINMLGLLDRYPYTVEQKGGSRQFHGTRIVLTSVEHPITMYKFYNPEEDVQQLARRITNIVRKV